MADIDKLKDEVLFGMCEHFTESGFDQLLSKQEIVDFVPNSAAGHIDFVLLRLMEEKKVQIDNQVDEDDPHRYYVMPDTYEKHVRENG